MRCFLRRREAQGGQSGLNGDIKRAAAPREVPVQTGWRATPDQRPKPLQNKSAAKHHFTSNFLSCLYLANQVGQRHLHPFQMWRWPQSACKELLQHTQLYLCQI